MGNTVRLRIVTWNLWGKNAPGPYLRDRGEFRGAVPDSRATQAFDGEQVWQHRRPLLVRDLKATKPHILCLQECLGAETSRAHDLAADLGLVVCDDARSPGLAILSHLPVKEVSTLPQLHGLHALIGIGPVDISVVCVHLPLARDGPRDQLVKELGAWRPSAHCTILAGDLNAAPSDNEIAALLEAGYVDVSVACGPTMPNPYPVVRLDYVLARNALPGIVSTVSAHVIGLEADGDGFLPSDHAGIAVEMDFSVSL